MRFGFDEDCYESDLKLLSQTVVCVLSFNRLLTKARFLNDEGRTSEELALSWKKDEQSDEEKYGNAISSATTMRSPQFLAYA